MEIAADTFKLCKDWGIKYLKTGDFEVEFFEPKPKLEPMALDPVSLSKTLADSMPPDSAMLFASSEELPGIDTEVIPGQNLNPSEP